MLLRRAVLQPFPSQASVRSNILNTIPPAVNINAQQRQRTEKLPFLSSEAESRGSSSCSSDSPRTVAMPGVQPVISPLNQRKGWRIWDSFLAGLQSRCDQSSQSSSVRWENSFTSYQYIQFSPLNPFRQCEAPSGTTNTSTDAPLLASSNRIFILPAYKVNSRSFHVYRATAIFSSLSSIASIVALQVGFRTVCADAFFSTSSLESVYGLEASNWVKVLGSKKRLIQSSTDLWCCLH